MTSGLTGIVFSMCLFLLIIFSLCSVYVPWSYRLASLLFVLILITGTLVERCDRNRQVTVLSGDCICYYICVLSGGCMYCLKYVSGLFLLHLLTLYSNGVKMLSMLVFLTLIGSSDFKESNFNCHIKYYDCIRNDVLVGHIPVMLIGFLPHKWLMIS